MAGSEHGALYAFDHGLTDRLGRGGLDATWVIDPHVHWNTPYGRAAHDALPPPGTVERDRIVQWHQKQLADAVRAQVESPRRAVTIGGDHSLGAGSVAGLRAALGPAAVIGVIWVDAHPDLHSRLSSVSKSIHGMPMGTILGLDRAPVVPGYASPGVRPQHVLYAGLRDIDPGEHDNAAQLGVSLTTMAALRRDGITETLRPALDRLMQECDAIVLSIDLDAFSSTVAPAVGSPVDGGFMPDEILPLLADCVARHTVPVIDIVEFNPTLPGAEQTCDFMVDVLKAVLAG